MANFFRKRFLATLAVMASLVPAAALLVFVAPAMTAELCRWLADNAASAWRLEFLEVGPKAPRAFSLYNGKIGLSFRPGGRGLLATATAHFDRGHMRIFLRPENGRETEIPESFKTAGETGQVFRFALSPGARYAFQEDVRDSGSEAEDDEGGLSAKEKTARFLAGLIRKEPAYDLFALALSPESPAPGRFLVRFTATGKSGSVVDANPDMEFPAKYPFLLPESPAGPGHAETLEFAGAGRPRGRILIPGRFLIPLNFLTEPVNGFVLARRSEGGAYSAVAEAGASARILENLAAPVRAPSPRFPVASFLPRALALPVPRALVDAFSGAAGTPAPRPLRVRAEPVSDAGRSFSPERDALFISGLGFTVREADFSDAAGLVTGAFGLLFALFFAAYVALYFLFPFFTVRFSGRGAGASLYSLAASGLTMFLVTGLTFLSLFLLLYLNLDATIYPELNKVHFYLDCAEGLFRVTLLSVLVFAAFVVLKAWRPSRGFIFGWFFDEARHARKFFYGTLASFAVSLAMFVVKPGRGIILLCESTLLLLFPLAFTSYLTYFRLKVKRRLSLGWVAVFSGLIPLLGFALPLALYDEFGPILIYSLFLFLAWPAVQFLTDKNRLLPVADESRSRAMRAFSGLFLSSSTIMGLFFLLAVRHLPSAVLFFLPLAYGAAARLMRRLGRAFSPGMAQTLFIVWLGCAATMSLIGFYQKDFDLPGLSTFTSRMDKMNVPAFRDDADIPHSLVYVPGTRLGSLTRRIHTDFAMSLVRSLMKDVFVGQAGTVLSVSLLLAYLLVLFLSLGQIEAYTRHQSLKRLNEPLFRFMAFAFVGIFALYSFLSTGCYLPLTGVPFPLVSDGDSYRAFTLALLWVSIVCPWQERSF